MANLTPSPKMISYRNWFAWYPVAFGPHLAWFKTIQRRYVVGEQSWYYRLIPADRG